MKKNFNTPASSWTLNLFQGIGSRNGFTLIELLVYMAMLSIIVLIAGRAFTDSTKFRVRTQNMLRATQEAENVAVLFKSDVSQMGSKRSVNAGSPADGTVGDNFSAVYGDTYIDPSNADDSKKDSSSFKFGEPENAKYDDFSFRYIRYDNQGHYVAVEEARWFVEGETLKRACVNVAGTPDANACPKESKDEARQHAVNIATGVKYFKVLPAKPNTLGGDKRLFPPAASGENFRLVPRTDDVSNFANLHVENNLGSANSAGTGQKLGGNAGPFFSNYDNENQTILASGRKVNELIAIGNDNTQGVGAFGLCKIRGGDHNGHILLKKDAEYELTFYIPRPTTNSDKSLLFVPGKDHMSVGFRNFFTGETPKKNGVPLIDDFMFFPPLSAKTGEGRRVMRFTVPEDIDSLCIAFTFACYSPLVSRGSLTIEDLKLRKLAYANYSFVEGYNPDIVDKQNVRAMRLSLVVARGGKGDKHGEADSIVVVVPTPSNGPRD